MALLPCPGCSSLQRAPESYRYRDPDGHFAEPLPLAECAECHLVFLSEPVKDDALYYSAYYGKGGGLPSIIFEPFNQIWVKLKADKIAGLLPGKSLLDFGCGRGDVLVVLKKRGFDAWGLETQPDAAAALRTVLVDHVVSKLEEIPQKKELFDGITLWHVLEHLDNPRETLQKLAKLAKPGAVLFAAVPNWDSWERRLFGDRWFHADVPRHILQFTPTSLSSLMSRSGWKVTSMRFDSWVYNIFGLFQSLLNVGPGPRNLFYRLGKRGTLSSASQPSIFIGMIWNVVAVIPAAFLAVFLVPFLTLLRKTGTLEIAAIIT